MRSLHLLGAVILQHAIGIVFPACGMGLHEIPVDYIRIVFKQRMGNGIEKTDVTVEHRHMHGVIRKTLGTLFGKDTSTSMIILYGGSVKPGNAGDLLSDPEIDGVLVGGASLRADSFEAIISSTCD